MVYDLVVVGGGAAGFFGAIQAAELRTAAKILIVEKSPKLLSKVRVSGGGRCNVTHNCFEARALATHYPRGEKVLKDVFKKYQANDVVTWFESKGVKLKAEADGRMFPTTDHSETIIDCFLGEAARLKIEVETGDGIVRVSAMGGKFELQSQKEKTYYARNVLIAMGGNPNPESYNWIAELGHTIIQPIPSLFTFNDSEKKFKDLMGVAVENAEVKIAGSKLLNAGPLLITHWGLSGPAVIRLSAWAAEYLHQLKYEFIALVSWIGSYKENDLRDFLLEHKKVKGKQKVTTNPMFGLPLRLWQRLCELSEIDEPKIWAELPQKNLNRLIEFLIRCPFQIKGKTTFKEEFVTCGGVDLKEISIETMESKIVKGLFFAGEVLNIDGETGGFNFQAAWSTAYIAASGLR
jgi:predicted Rossmann fold flavoprotein